MLLNKTSDANKLLYEKTLAEMTLLIEPKCYSHMEGAADTKTAWDASFTESTGISNHKRAATALSNCALYI